MTSQKSKKILGLFFILLIGFLSPNVQAQSGPVEFKQMSSSDSTIFFSNESYAYPFINFTLSSVANGDAFKVYNLARHGSAIDTTLVTVRRLDTYLDNSTHTLTTSTPVEFLILNSNMQNVLIKFTAIAGGLNRYAQKKGRYLVR